MPALVLVTPSVLEPLAVDEVKQHLRVDHASDDAYIASMITMARQTAESKMRRALMQQDWKLSLSQFPVCELAQFPVGSMVVGAGAKIKLPFPPLMSILSLTYVDVSGQTQTMNPAGYVVGQDKSFGTVRPAYGTSWPNARYDENSINITYRAGYASAGNVPEPIKAWMKLMIGTLYENREAVVHGETASAVFLPRGFADGLLDPYVVPAMS